jgi:hypothetical protein
VRTVIKLAAIATLLTSVALLPREGSQGVAVLMFFVSLMTLGVAYTSQWDEEERQEREVQKSKERQEQSERYAKHRAEVESYGGCDNARFWLWISAVRSLDHEQVRLRNADGVPYDAVRLRSAVDSGLVRVIALSGAGLERATITLEPSPSGTLRKVFIPLGMTLVSAEEHQTMVVRTSISRSLDSRVDLEVPVACVNFHKRVPTNADVFGGFGEADSIVMSVLNVALTLEDVDEFVIQLAVWSVTDHIPLQVVSIRTVEHGRRTVRRPTRCEIVLAEAIVAKARELVRI